MVKDDLLKQANIIKIETVLDYYGIHEADSYKRYRCIDPGHTDKHPSSSIDKSRNRFKCFGCGKIFSPIDVVSIMEGVSDLRECAKKVLDISNVEFVPTEKTPNTNSNNASVKKDTKKKLTIQDRENMLVKGNINILKDYLTSRAIDPDVVLPILDKNGVVYGADKLGQSTFIFKKFGVCIYRFVKENENRVTGINAPITVVSDSSCKDWWIVEGIFDALTLLNFKKNVICLNTVNNIKALTDKISSNKTKMTRFNYIIATDNDSAGLTAKSELETFFNNNNINYKSFNKLYSSNYKDLNDMKKAGVL